MLQIINLIVLIKIELVEIYISFYLNYGINIRNLFKNHFIYLDKAMLGIMFLHCQDT